MGHLVKGMGKRAAAHHKGPSVPGQGARPLPWTRVFKQWVTWSDLGFKRPYLEDSLEEVSRRERSPKGCPGQAQGWGGVRWGAGALTPVPPRPQAGPPILALQAPNGIPQSPNPQTFILPFLF